MVSLGKLKEIATAFIKDACKYLGMEGDVPMVIFTPYFDKQSFNPLFWVSDNDEIVISELELKRLCQKGCTPLRTNMIGAVRFIERRRKLNGWNWFAWGESDAFCYANTILFLKGFKLPDPANIGLARMHDGVPKIIQSEFGLSCYLRTLHGLDIGGTNLIDLQMSTAEEEREYARQTKKETFKSVQLHEEEKGGIENPFDNIHQAIDFLREEERRAYEADSRLHEIENMKYCYDLNTHQFRIPWAWPHVAHQRNNFSKKAFIMSEMAPLDKNRPDIFYFSLKPNLYGHKFLYRGQNDHYSGKPCVPNMFRDEKRNMTHDFLDFEIFAHEMELVIKSHPIVKMLEEGIELLHDTFRIRMHYKGLAQHYYNKSNFLDLTSDLDVVSFFATTGYDAANDKYYPFRDTSKLGVIYYYELKFGSSDIWSDNVANKKKTAEQVVSLKLNKQKYNNEQQFSISCLGALWSQMHL